MNPPSLSYNPLGWVVRYKPNDRKVKVYFNTFNECVEFCIKKELQVKEEGNLRPIYKDGKNIGSIRFFLPLQKLAAKNLKRKPLNLLSRKWGVKPNEVPDLLKMDDFKRFIYLNGLRK